MVESADNDSLVEDAVENKDGLDGCRNLSGGLERVGRGLLFGLKELHVGLL